MIEMITIPIVILSMVMLTIRKHNERKKRSEAILKDERLVNNN